jgi:hypothetical protein
MLIERISLVAELAVALAGFASIVAVIGQRQGRDSTEIDAIRLQWMLGISLYTAACALLPSLPLNAGVSENLTWRMCSFGFATSGGAILALTLRRLSRVAEYPLGRGRSFFDPNSLSWLVLSCGLMGSAVVLLLVAAVGWIPRPSVVYLWGLYVYLSVAALLFLRLVRSLLIGGHE